MLLEDLNPLSEMRVYHGSDSEIDRFDPERVGSASGLDKGGWGFYFSDSEEVASQYAPGNGSVAAYNIPNSDYLNLDDGVDLGWLQRVKDELEEANVDEDELEEFSREFMEDESYMASTSVEDVYTWVGHVVGSRKNASRFFALMGYTGTRFSDKTNRDATNYVVFDSGDIRKL